MKKNTGRAYQPTMHRVKVLYSVTLTPEELYAYWVSKFATTKGFEIRKAIIALRQDLEAHGTHNILD